MAKPKTTETTELQVHTVKTGKVDFYLVGTTPLIYNAMSFKAQQDLLYPKGKKTEADKAENMKHNPIEEYRASVYAHKSDSAVTRLMFPCGGFKKAMSTAALDLPGLRKSQIGRLVWITERDIDIYGVPMLTMNVVRSADMAKTPDVRTRAIVPNWACKISVNFVQPQLNVKNIGNLLASAGVLVGIGDWRQEKGSNNFGQFEVVGTDDLRLRRIIKAGTRVAQDRALANPAFYDLESQRLFEWFNKEVTKRGDEGKRDRKKVA